MAVAAATRRRPGNAVYSDNSPLTGQPFLKTSINFDDVTTFRQNYTAHPLQSCHRDPVKPLPPASVIHQNACYLKMQSSLTQNTYQPPTLLKGEELHLRQGEEKASGSSQSSRNVPNKVFATNFHLNADWRLDTHCTTNQEGFPPLVPRPAVPASHYKDIESGPLGGRVFDPLAKSEYCSVFGGGHLGSRGQESEGVRLPVLKPLGQRNTLTGNCNYTTMIIILLVNIVSLIRMVEVCACGRMH